MSLPSLADAAGRLRSLLPGQAPAPFQASDPASKGGASSPLLWLAVFLVCIVAGLWIAAGFFGLPSAVAFCFNLTATAMVVGILVPLIGLMLNYRSRNKEAAASVVRATIAAVAPPAPSTADGGAP
jgi:hypothetical protein